MLLIVYGARIYKSAWIFKSHPRRVLFVCGAVHARTLARKYICMYTYYNNAQPSKLFSSHFHVDMVQLRFIYPRTDNEPHYIGVPFKRYMVKFICSSATSYTHTLAMRQRSDDTQRLYFPCTKMSVVYIFNVSSLNLRGTSIHMHKLI